MWRATETRYLGQSLGHADVHNVNGRLALVVLAALRPEGVSLWYLASAWRVPVLASAPSRFRLATDNLVWQRGPVHSGPQRT